MNKIYSMKLHEIIEIGGWRILRVPSGWIYTHYRLDANQMTSVFVPYSDEFFCIKE